MRKIEKLQKRQDKEKIQEKKKGKNKLEGKNSRKMGKICNSRKETKKKGQKYFAFKENINRITSLLLVLDGSSKRSAHL